MTDTTPRELIRLVLDKITELGDKQAQEYFEVSAGTISAWKTLKTFPSIVAAQKVWDDSLAAQSPEIWGGNGKENVCILMPSYEGIEPQTMVTLLKSIKHYGMDKITIIPEFRTLIDEARNTLVQKFMLTGRPDSLFVDSDMIFPCGSTSLVRKYGLKTPDAKASRNAIERIMSHPKEFGIVGALYRNRRGTFKPACARAYLSEAEDKRLRGLFDGSTQADGLEETGWVGFGMVRVQRWVYEKMQEAAAPGGPLADMAPPVGREHDAFGYFGRTPQWRGEDISFCRRAEKIGIKTYIDTGLLLGHVFKGVC